MDSLRSAATTALRSLLAEQPTTSAKVAFAWRIAAGPALGRAGTARWSDDGVLRLQARDAAWRQEFERARPIVAERLAQLLGAGVVRKIVIESSRRP